MTWECDRVEERDTILSTRLHMLYDLRDLPTETLVEDSCILKRFMVKQIDNLTDGITES